MGSWARAPWCTRMMCSGCCENFGQVRTHPTVEYRFRHKELGYRWVSDSRSVVFDDRGGSAVIGALRDITERKRAEEELRGSEERFRLHRSGCERWNLGLGSGDRCRLVE